VLRTTYSAPFRFHRDDDDERKVIWYYVPEDREFMPWAHAFGSQLYHELDDALPGPGEKRPQAYYGGMVPAPYTDGGLCGNKEQWQYGPFAGDPIPPTWGDSDIPRCCKPPIGAAGGLAIGGEGQELPPDACCEGVILPATLTLTWTSTAGTWPAVDGLPITMFQDSVFVDALNAISKYRSDPIDSAGTLVTFWLICTIPPNVSTLYATDPSGFGSVYVIAVPDTAICDPFTWSLSGGVFASVPPAVVVTGADVDLVP